uniref:MAPEG family protein, expressed n=1 Tax=Oryza sativa subsp. japonica TaxID=39947 RepID=Q10E41_ORYSJ|nr:MAPEG family protein, expressed [Oryza sativa Japonica Group]
MRILVVCAAGAPELAGDDAAVLRHAAGRRAAAPARRRGARGVLRRREVLLLQGLRHRHPGQPPQDWGAELLGDLWVDHLHGFVRHQPGPEGIHLSSSVDP